MLMREFINSLDRADVLEMIADYEQLERVGSVGDCLLRRNAHTINMSLTKGDFGGGPILWMEKLAFESYRRIATEVINEKD